MSEDTKIPEIIKNLAEAASQQTKVANRHWLTLAGLSLLIIIPKPVVSSTAAGIGLPFNLGIADPNTYYIVTSLLISAITISFCSAHAQVVRAQWLFEKSIAKYKLLDNTEHSLHPRDIYDVLRLPNISRVAPLAMIARGEHQFYSDPLYLTSNFRRIITGIYYIVLKVVSFTIYVGLPVYALYKSGASVYVLRCNISVYYNWIIWAFIIVSCITLAHVIINEILYSRRVIDKVFKKKTKNSDNG